MIVSDNVRQLECWFSHVKRSKNDANDGHNLRSGHAAVDAICGDEV
jgi:hypothetical protein